PRGDRRGSAARSQASMRRAERGPAGAAARKACVRMPHPGSPFEGESSIVQEGKRMKVSRVHRVIYGSLGFAILCAAGLAAQQKAAPKGDDPGIAKVRTAYQTAAAAQDGAAIAKLYAPDGVEMPP